MSPNSQEPRHWNLQIDADRVAFLVLDKAQASANVLSAQVLRELNEKLTELQRQPPAALVLCSAKKNGFIAGADIKEFVGLRTPQEAYELIHAGQVVFDLNGITRERWDKLAKYEGQGEKWWDGTRGSARPMPLPRTRKQAR